MTAEVLASDAPAASLAAWRERIAPGVYDSMPPQRYHADDSLSASGMKLLLAPGCPAQYRYERDNPRPPKKVFDFGHAAHRLVLGAGEDLATIHADNWTTKAARANARVAREDGRVPLLAADMEKAEAMAAVVHRHPIAGALFRGGRPELSLFWTERVTWTEDGTGAEYAAEVRLRSRIDWANDPGESRLILGDYKTTTSVDLEAIEKTVYNYGYHVQDAQYRAAAQACGLGDADTVMVFVFQSKDPPFLVRVVQLELNTLRLGRAKRAAAIKLFAECQRKDSWPGYDEVAYAALPPWAEAKDEEYTV